MKISEYYRSALRFPLNRRNRKRLTNTNFSIVCNTCVGGIISHELGQRFNSPTINLGMSCEDYIKFLTRLEHYLSIPLKEIQTDKRCPVGVLEDITIYFVHYHSFEEAAEKWNIRAKRVNMDNLYVILVDQRGCTDDIVRSFCNLPYKHKVMLSTEKRMDYDCIISIPQWRAADGGLIDICRYKGKFTGRREIDDFDYVQFLNDTNQ